MDKKVTTIAGIALGAALVAGFGIYKYFSKKSGNKADTSSTGYAGRNVFTGGYIGNSLAKSAGLYVSQADNGLVGGGLLLSPAATRTHG